MNKKGMLGNLIGGFIVILVGVTLLPFISDALEVATMEGNVTGASESIVGLVTLFFALAVAGVALQIVLSGLRGAGVIGSSSDEDDEDEQDQENDEDEEEETFVCVRCKQIRVTQNQKHESGYCDSCEDEPLCDECLLEDVELCYKCVEEKKKKPIKVEKEEVKPIITKEKTSFEKKSKFEEKSKYD